jgi:hypothetical protein
VSPLLRAGLVAAGLAAGLAAAELAMRGAEPPARTQVVRPAPPGLTLEENEVGLYWQKTPSDRRNEGCVAEHPGRRRAAWFGSSIVYGVNLDGPEVFTGLLQSAPEGEGWCLLNYAESGYGFQAKLAAATASLPALRPEVVFWEVWSNDNARYTRVGDAAYNLDEIALDAGGTPAAFPVPPGLNRLLFTRSRLYEYLTLALVPEGYRRGPDIDRQLAREGLPAVKRLVEGSGGLLVLSFWPPLHQPFEDSVGRYYDAARAWAAAEGVPTIDVAERLRGEDYLALRLDPCCHYSAAGHRALAGIFGPALAATPGSPGR